jgi:hypothetical protein
MVLLTAEFKKDLYLLITQTYVKFLEDNSPVQSGNLKRNWKLIEEEPMVYIIYNEAEYSQYLDEGTGIYGPKKKKIVPKVKKALSFTIGGHKIVVKSVKGIKPLMMVQKAATSKKVQEDFDKGLQELLEKHFLPAFK